MNQINNFRIKKYLFIFSFVSHKIVEEATEKKSNKFGIVYIF